MPKFNFSEIISDIKEKHGASLSDISRLTNINKVSLSLANNNKIRNLKNISKLIKLQKVDYRVKNKDRKNFIIKRGKRIFVNIFSILPQKTHSNHILYARKHNKNLIVWYRPKNINKIELVLPQFMILDERFFENLGLSVGDATININKRNTHYNFGNTNLKLVIRIKDWLKKYFNISEEKFNFFIISKTQPKEFLDYAQRKLQKKIKVYYSKRHGKPTLTLQLSSSIFIALHKSLFEELKCITLKSKKFREAFLRGLFAAEGHIKHSKYGTIESITFAYNPKIETYLANFVVKCLELEDVKAKHNNKGTVYVCGYENMLKLFNKNLYSIHRKKEEKFINLCRNAIFSIFLNSSALKRLKLFSQLDIAKYIDCNQASISSWLSQKNGIRIGLFIRIFKLLKLKRKNLINNIDLIKVANSTVKDKKSIKFLLSFYKFEESDGKIKLNENRKLGINSTLFFYLYYINLSLKENGYISTRYVSNLINRPLITVQQRIKDYVNKGLLKPLKFYYREGYRYKLTDYGLKTLKNLSEIYSI